MPVPPQQNRSRRTLDRLLEASESLLKRKRFEEISVAELAREPRSSVGSFYARFPGKDALLDFLDGRARWFWDDCFDPGRGG
jgi:AcrR family transcriptional regulator